MDNNFEVLIGQLIEATSSAADSVKQLAEDTHKNEIAINDAVGTLRAVNAVVQDLQKVVIKGNAKPALVVQIELLSVALEKANKDIDKINKEKASGETGCSVKIVALEKKWEQYRRDLEVEEAKNRRARTGYIIGMAIAVIGGLCGIISALILLLSKTAVTNDEAAVVLGAAGF